MAKIKAAPSIAAPSILKRAVKVFDEDGTLLRTDKVDATYFWKIEYNGKTYEICGDFHLPCLPAVDSEDMGPKIATITKIGLPHREIRYGPADIYQGQVQAWITANALR